MSLADINSNNTDHQLTTLPSVLPPTIPGVQDSPWFRCPKYDGLCCRDDAVVGHVLETRRPLSTVVLLLLRLLLLLLALVRTCPMRLEQNLTKSLNPMQQSLNKAVLVAQGLACCCCSF